MGVDEGKGVGVGQVSWTFAWPGFRRTGEFNVCLWCFCPTDLRWNKGEVGRRRHGRFTEQPDRLTWFEESQVTQP